ncbi:hypothetical protein [Chryseobacterium sp.]|nr:hypothetical protein [Chryseobacterium sp.]
MNTVERNGANEKEDAIGKEIAPLEKDVYLFYWENNILSFF